MTHESFPVGRRALLLAGVGGLIMPAAACLAEETGTPPGPRFTPESFGAMGNGRDDTAGLMAMVDAVNRAGSGHIVFTPGKTYLLGHASQVTLVFKGCDGVRLEGQGATLKTRDNGAPTAMDGQSWGQLNFVTCRNVEILGLTLDGNRGRQRHTAGHPDGYGFNAGINFHAGDLHLPSSDILIRDCRFIDHGVLSSTTDSRGDAIFAVSGIKRMRIENCLFERVGRWAFALAEGARPSEHIYFTHNKVLNENREATGIRPWGAVDVEDIGVANKHIYIEDNLFTGTAQVAFGGFKGGTPFEVTCEDIYIRRNSWRIPASSAGTNVPFSIGFSLPGTGSYRELRRLFIEDNVVIWEGVAIAFHIGHTAKLRDVFIRRNKFIAQVPTASTEGGLTLGYGGHLEGRIEISDNEFTGLGEAILNAGVWYDDPSPEPLILVVERNRFDKCTRAFNFQLVGAAAPPGSRALFRANRSTNTRSENGEYLDGGNVGIDLYNRSFLDRVSKHVRVREHSG